MNNRKLAKLAYLSNSMRHAEGYDLVIVPHAWTESVLELDSMYIRDYRIGCAIVRAIREELQRGAQS